MYEIDADIVLVHISDIHFRSELPLSEHDPDYSIREALKVDLNELAGAMTIDAVIISGDIAFSGKPKEYEFASNWLETVSQALNLENKSIFVTPGNHDIDRDIVTNISEISEMQAQVRGGRNYRHQDEILGKILTADKKGRLLLSSMSAYNEFACKFDCDVNANKIYWQKEFNINGDQKIHLRGLTSTLLSGPADNVHANKLFLGAAQRSIPRQANVHTIVVGHHPPSWLMDGEEVEKVFSEQTILQCYGHVHQQWQVRIGKSVRVISGALHPSNSEENWRPRYSAIAIKVNSGKMAKIRIFPRVYNDEFKAFMPDYTPDGIVYRDYD